MSKEVNIADSVATTTDGVAAPRPWREAQSPQPWVESVSTVADVPTAMGRERATSTGVADFMHGLRPEPRAVLPGYDSSVMSLLVVVFLLMAVNFGSFGTFIKTYTPDLFKERRRDSFYDTHTISETRVLLSLLLIATVSEGILVFSMLNFKGMIPPGAMFATMTVAIAWAIGYYIAQVVAYNYIGFLFATPDQTRQWVKGFNASQSLLGIAIAVPALIALFNPGAAPLLATIGLFLYLTARIIFICKGFRLFYNKIGSLLYFILYLCAIEIMPLYLAYQNAFVRG